ncbi:hypothetical protein MicB006_2749 [Micromonospora sp. B006]|nr:hypothetical protein MicB006_2749 [Micromonospora sp. B006]
MHPQLHHLARRGLRSPWSSRHRPSAPPSPPARPALGRRSVLPRRAVGKRRADPAGGRSNPCRPGNRRRTAEEGSRA